MTPFRVPPEWTWDVRIARLEAIADAGVTDPETQRRARAILAFAVGFRLLARVGLAEVQRLPFVADPPGDDDYYAVGETWRRGGDCEDLSAALVALYRALGLRARLAWMELDPGAAQTHVTVQVSPDPVSVPSDRASWWYAEPSVRAELGEEPVAAAIRTQSYAPFGGSLTA